MSRSIDHVDADRAAAAFGNLSDPVRVDILRALREHRGGLSFAALQEAVGVADSGRFNYHLDKLTDHFVRRTDDGYELRPAGLRATALAAAGGFTGAPSLGPVSLAADCPECGTGLRAEYDNGWLEIACPDCGVVPHFSTFPPRGVATRGTEAFLRAYSARVRRQFSLATAGVCPFCGGRSTGTLDADPDWYLDVAAHSHCESCTSHVGTPVGLRLLDRPAVGTFLRERGVDHERPFWTFEWCLSAAGVEVVSRDPLRVVQPIERDGDELRLTVGEDLEVVEIERLERR